MVKCLIVFVLIIAIGASSPPHKRGLSYHNGRIVGGSNAVDGQYPYHAALTLANLGLICSASIVEHEWVVTAANCARYSQPQDMGIYAGSVKINSGGTKYAVKEIHYNDDVAILKVDYITYTDKISPIILETEDVADNEPCIVTGWGQIETGEYPNNLQYLNVSTITHEICLDDEICTSSGIGKGLCYGDIGAPLVRKVNGFYRQIGISSWLFPCGEGLPDGYFKVSLFIDWFREKCNFCV